MRKSVYAPYGLVGVRSGHPVKCVWPDNAVSTGPKPGCASYGPPRPSIDALSITTRGLTLAIRS